MRSTPLPIVGVELGARMENTAISVTERVYLPTGERFTAVSYHDYNHGRERLRAREKVTVEYRVRLLERRSPPVRYKGVAERVAELVGALGKCVVAMDLTRTGRPVHALIMGAVHEATKDTRTSVSQCPITVTGEHGAVSPSPDVGWLVPRRDLVSSALTLLRAGAAQDRPRARSGADAHAGVYGLQAQGSQRGARRVTARQQR